MSDELTETKKCVEEVLIDLMVEKVMSEGIQVSSMRGVQASLSTTHGSRPSQDATEKRTKNQDDLVNAKMIPTILPDYILPLAGTVSHDSVLRDFDYTLVTAYLPKGIMQLECNRIRSRHLNSTILAWGLQETQYSLPS
jgi:hypothetical protein